MDCHSNLLGSQVVREGRAALTNNLKCGASKVQRSCGSVVSLHIAFPLELCVSHGQDLIQVAMRGYPRGDGCGGGCLKLGPEVSVSALQQFMVAPSYGGLNTVGDVLIVDHQVGGGIALVRPQSCAKLGSTNGLAPGNGSRSGPPPGAFAVCDLPANSPRGTTKEGVCRVTCSPIAP